MSRRFLTTAGLAAALSGCGTNWSEQKGTEVDADGDGYSPAQGDCWDVSGEVVIDGVATGVDGASVHPGAIDAPYDGLDADCAGDDDFDADGDGYVPLQYLASTILNNPSFDIGARPQDADCADVEDDYTGSEVHFPAPGATLPDPADVFPGAPVDTWYDGIDADCLGGDDFDQDGDGFASADHEQIDGSVGADCQDEDASVNPDAVEVCDDLDNDCDTLVDGDDGDFDVTTLRDYYTDADADGFGDPASLEQSCSPVPDTVDNGDDCDDGNPGVNPAADEICDPDDVDENCNGFADDIDETTVDAGKTTLYADTDSDTYGDPGVADLFCDPVDGYVENNGDCDDGNGAINPAAAEVCDAADVDENCDGVADDDDGGVDVSGFSTFYADTDADGFGDPTTTQDQCDPGGGFIADNTDCDDGNGSINPGATEVCDAGDVDEDCDGAADDADPSLDTTTQATYYVDDDSDAYGDSADGGTGYCLGDQPAGLVLNADDCDDSDQDVNPGEAEICDADDTDEDCSGLADDDDAGVDVSTQDLYYADSDGDSFGDETDAGVLYCDPPASVVADNTDCDDGVAGVNPGATEICDAAGVDENCNGLADDADGTLDVATQDAFYVDDDGDGYGDATASAQLYCDGNEPSGVVADATDCDDGLAAINPSATEICDGSDTDEDCDGLADDADPSVDTSTQSTYYVDGDLDGFGDLSNTTLACDPDSGVVSDSTDCDDTDVLVYPEAGETCNDGVDTDCDGSGTTETVGASTTSVCSLEPGVMADEAALILQTGSAILGTGEALAASDLDGSGDGVQELVFGSPGSTYLSSTDVGSVWVLPTMDGDPVSAGTTLTVSTSNAVRFRGGSTNEWAGASLAVGNINNDAYVDLIVGAPGYGRNTGGNNPTGAIFGILGPIGATPGLTALSAAADFIGNGKSNGSFLGADVFIGGDADGDGISGDILISNPACGAAFYGSDTSTGTGKVYLLAAGGSPIPTDITHSGSSNVDAYWIGSACGGWSLGMGDLDGTGVDSVVMSEPTAPSSLPRGRVYIDKVANGNTLLNDADFVRGPALSSHFGDALAVGDLDQDGYEDVIASATYNAVGTGVVYVLYGNSGWSDGDAIHTVAGATITAAASNTRFGASLSLAGDMDDDGNLDLVIGEPDGATGSAWLMYGPFTGSMTASASTGDQWTSTTTDAGRAVLGDVDLNNDGYSEFLVGAPSDSAVVANGGRTFLFSALGD